MAAGGLVRLDSATGLIDEARQISSPNCDERERFDEPEVVVLHCISLPPGKYGGPYITDLFSNQLDPNADPYFKDIAQLRVSAHFLIRRDGELIQCVPTTLRAWHAGDSICQGRPKVNDFSLGIELEGSDMDATGYEPAQYKTLNELCGALSTVYKKLRPENYFAHSDIAPGRKTDPGPYFRWDWVI